MKKTKRMRGAASLVALLLLSATAAAQPKGYEFTYEQTMKLDPQKASLQGGDADAEFIMNLLGNLKSYYTLTYAGGKSLFEQNSAMSESTFSTGGGDKVYVDFEEQQVVHVSSFLGRTFLIEESMEQRSWTITDEHKEIAGLNCTKAVLNDSVQTVVWFAANTPIPAGPNTYYGLPGLVAEASIGPLTYTLTEVKVLTKTPTIKKPTKGKKVTREEMQNIILKKTGQTNLGGNSTGGAIRIIEM